MVLHGPDQIAVLVEFYEVMDSSLLPGTAHILGLVIDRLPGTVRYVGAPIGHELLCENRSLREVFPLSFLLLVDLFGHSYGPVAFILHRHNTSLRVYNLGIRLHILCQWTKGLGVREWGRDGLRNVGRDLS